MATPSYREAWEMQAFMLGGHVPWDKGLSQEGGRDNGVRMGTTSSSASAEKLPGPVCLMASAYLQLYLKWCLTQTNYKICEQRKIGCYFCQLERALWNFNGCDKHRVAFVFLIGAFLPAQGSSISSPCGRVHRWMCYLSPRREPASVFPCCSNLLLSWVPSKNI